METLSSISSIATVIQLAVAPVFLLAGIAGLLNVLSIRLGRVVDRVRVVETRRSRETHEDHRALLQAETNSLWNRIRLVDWSFRSLVAGALIVCLVIMALFLSELSHLNFSSLIAFLFVCSMCLVILGLVLFLFEVSLSTSSIREGIDSMIKEEAEHSLESADD
ncbi:MAG: DUF2721 domain-containing protein [Gammaproteobacteria bacterium]|jgi:hypothetical protein|nr:DUF2721 domain-containing protein [Gammaproteobacteria bacterium]